MKISSIPAIAPIGALMERRARRRALAKVGGEDRFEEMVRRAAAELGLTVSVPADGEHLDFVNLVEVDEREDGIYVFAEHADAERFADAVDHEVDARATVEFHRAFVSETPVNLGAAAERLIAAERGDALEDVFGPALAEDVREGVPLESALRRLEEVGEGDSVAAGLLRRWIEPDRRTDGALDPAGAGQGDGGPTPPPVRAYTVVGCRGRGGAPYVTTVRTADGPEVALDLAHDDFEEDRPRDREVELEIVAIFHGEPELVDFDSPEPTAAKGGASR
jgi:hypothetical protein